MISIHPSLAGRDVWANKYGTDPENFNPPVPRGTGRIRENTTTTRTSNFNPPVPRGTGQKRSSNVRELCEFQSTRPSRDGTCRTISMCSAASDFNPPVPRGTGLFRFFCGYSLFYFNPPVPRGTGRSDNALKCAPISISIHPSLAGRDLS